MSDENDSYTEVTSTSWFSRLGDSFKGIGTGFLLIIAATALLWWNEGRTVRTGDAIVEAQLATEPMPAITKVDSAFEGKMVYATGRAVTKDELTDPVFGVKVNAIKLRRKVEYYQWVEHRRSEKRQKLGGGEETVTTYTYSREWVNHPVDSQSFKQMVGHENKTRIQTEAADWLAPNVTFGAYRFPAFLARSIGGEKPLGISLTDTQRAELQKAFFAPNASLDASQVVGQQGASMIHTQTNTIYVGREPGARVPLGHSGMAHEALVAQDVAAQDAVGEIGTCAAAMDAWSVGVEDADVVEHGGLVHEFRVHPPLRMPLHDVQGACGHHTAVFQKRLFKLRLVAIIVMYQF